MIRSYSWDCPRCKNLMMVYLTDEEKKAVVRCSRCGKLVDYVRLSRKRQRVEYDDN